VIQEANGRGNSCATEFRVRYAECDGFGYFHHARYWEYFEVARTELLRKCGFRYRDLEEQGVYFVVHKAACKYIRPIRYDDLIRVEVWVTRVTRTRVEHGYEIVCNGEVTTTAESLLVCVGRDGRPREMPDSLWERSQPG
jgi:acyl-CoA thioester hydrolase